MIMAEASKQQVTLIPWDPESQSHIDRLFQQRIACGWHEDKISEWREKQRQGKKTLQWIILSPDDPASAQKQAQHVSAYPLEAGELTDTAVSLGGKPRPPLGTSFLPVGHISLDPDPTDRGLEVVEEGTYLISTFYISRALQGSGLGRAAMDIVEKMAVDEPLCAKVLTLDTVANDYPKREERLKALGRPGAKLSNADWYARRGYTIYDYKDDHYWDTDPTGKRWGARAVFMKKHII
ncbi:hypothetical protein PVAG01_04182 [Phlyctema vagabunda]|uniref:N-acetyltransferase domain-containing protein n=1 Tax=Phlyctema vagabunda TaxID=108571 RepID=A0ABR4PNM0_9HELO